MKISSILACLVLLNQMSLMADEYEKDYSPVIFPMQSGEVAPTGPFPIAEIRPDRMYVLRSNSEHIFRQVSSGGKLGFEDLRAALPDDTDKSTPIILRGLFADGDGKQETKVFSEKFIYLVNGLTAGQVEILIIPKGVLEDKDIDQQTLTVMGLSPLPPPIPIPPTPIPPNPDPPPTPTVDKVSIAVVHDALNISPDTAIVLNTLAYWSSLTDSGNDWRIYDKDTREEEGLKAVKAVQGLLLPAIVIVPKDKSFGSKEDVLYIGALPKNAADLKTLVDTYRKGN